MTFFIDLDGTFFKFLTNTPIDGCVEEVRNLRKSGHKVIFTTLRDKVFHPEEINLKNTVKALRKLGVKYDGLIGGLDSPRVVVNDAGAYALNVKKDVGFAGVLGAARGLKG